MNAVLSPAAISFALAAVTDPSAQFDQAVSPAGLQRVGWALLHFLWQGSAVTALLVIALRLLRRQSAVIRYRVACAALLAMTVAPVATYCFLSREISELNAGPSGLSSMTTRDLPVHGIQSNNAEGISVASEPSTPAVSTTPVITGTALGATVAKSPWTWVVACWAVGVAALSAWRAGGWLRLRWLVRRIAPVGGDWTGRMQTLALQMSVRRPVRLAEAAWVAVPCVLGFFRPMVLMPAAALAGLTPAQLEAILAHELAHVRRNDYLVNLAQAALETVLFYHPAVWWVSARVREEREFCCDDLAAATRPNPADYADALAAAEVMSSRDARSLPSHLALAALGNARTDGPLLRRVRRVLGLPPGRTGDRVFVRPLTAIAIAAACVAMPWVIARADKSPAAAPSADALPTTVPATAPSSTGPADPLAAAEPPGPDDLVADKQPYRIGPNDLLTIEVSDLTGPGSKTVKTTRVKENGTITMLYVSSPIHAEGLTEAQLEKAILDRYHIENIVQKSQVTVILTEARGRAFKILGDVPRPGQYAIADPGSRVLDALTLSGVDVTKLEKIYIVRTPKVDQTAHDLDVHPTAKSEFKVFHLKHVDSDTNARLLLEVFKLPEDAKDKPAPGWPPYGVNAVSDARNNNVLVTAPPEAMNVVEQIIHEADRSPTIVIPAKGLAAGDPKLNVVIHKGDTIIARGVSR